MTDPAKPTSNDMRPPNVDPKHLDPDGPPHPDRATEIQILRWALDYGPTERDPWTQPAD